MSDCTVLYVVSHCIDNRDADTLELTAYADTATALEYCRQVDGKFTEKRIKDWKDVEKHGALYHCYYANRLCGKLRCTRYCFEPDASASNPLCALTIKRCDHSGESYDRGEYFVYTGLRDDMIDVFDNWFDEEHNRDDVSLEERCRRCLKGKEKKCRKRTHKSLLEKGYVFLGGDDQNAHEAWLKVVQIR